MTQEKKLILLTMMPKGVEHRGFAAQVLALCSTPFGIIGILTPNPRSMRCNRTHRCAQRLSASSEFSLNIVSHAVAFIGELCSTPFGIIGILTHSISDKVTCHTFRATGITEYLRNGGTIEKAAQIAAHESIRNTQLYNRVDDALSLDEIERVRI